MTSRKSEIVHGSAVALGGRGLLIQGPSGSGKSALALELMALGAGLVADDRTCVTATPDGLILTRPDTLPAAIEARFVGLLAAETVPEARLAAVVDLGQQEDERLPARREIMLLGHPIPLFRAAAKAYFPAALAQFLKAGLRRDL